MHGTKNTAPFATKVKTSLNRCAKLVFRNDLTRKKLAIRFYNATARLNHLNPKAIHSKHVDIRKATQYYNLYTSSELYRANSFYGISQILKNYSGYEGPIYACIEHGLYLGDYVNPLELSTAGLAGVITFGPSRIAALEKAGESHIYPIGPYIQYATSDATVKQQLHSKLKSGKTILVIPAHSTDLSSATYSSKDILDSVDAIKKRVGAENVIVNLYYKDCMRNDLVAAYTNAGFLLTCAGHINDSRFLPRLRSIIESCDLVITNEIGTHVGYSLALGKPVHTLPKSVDYIFSIDDNASLLALDKSLPDKDRIRQAFSQFSESITPCQKKIFDHYWGGHINMTSKELYTLLNDIRTKFNLAHKSL